MGTLKAPEGQDFVLDHTARELQCWSTYGMLCRNENAQLLSCSHIPTFPVLPAPTHTCPQASPSSPVCLTPDTCRQSNCFWLGRGAFQTLASFLAGTPQPRPWMVTGWWEGGARGPASHEWHEGRQWLWRGLAQRSRGLHIPKGLGQLLLSRERAMDRSRAM